MEMQFVHTFGNNTTSVLPHEFDHSPWMGVVYGYLSPLVIVCIVATNSLVCVVLCSKNLRTPTNVFLVAMALSDTLTGLFALPMYLSFYTTNNYHDWIPFQWCRAYYLFIDQLPTVFHTASIWLTVCLAAQRYLIVCRPTSAKSLCTMCKSLKTVFGVFVLSFLFHSFIFFDLEYSPVMVTSKFSNQTVLACDDRSRVQEYEENLYQVYIVARVVFVHLLPCVLLSLFNAVLVQAMRRAGKRRKQLLKQNMRMEGSRLEENNRTTLMLVIVVAIFLLVEIPLALFFLIFVTASHVMTKEHLQMITMVLNFIVLLTYPLNFFIYCRMSRQFRKSFRRMFDCGTGGGSQVRNGCEGVHAKNLRGSDGVELTTLNKGKYPEKNTCMLTIDENTAVGEN